jgi:NAD(P)-dependent dehydrogenase (short-subunit alcohol dehydrogenase family)
MDSLAGKVAWITGASRGIGHATALAMARAGAQVVVTARTKGQLEALADQILAETGQHALPCAADLAQETDIKRTVQTALAIFGRIDILVNNAGFNSRKAPLWEVTTEEWDAMMAVNLRGAFLCCREVLPSMIERRSGHIINVISTAAEIGLEAMGAYSATKWGLLGMTRVLTKEARRYGIRVSAISPGGTDTTFRAVPRPDYLAPETVAEAIVFMASLPEQAVVHDLIVRPIVETNF